MGSKQIRLKIEIDDLVAHQLYEVLKEKGFAREIVEFFEIFSEDQSPCQLTLVRF